MDSAMSELYQKHRIVDNRSHKMVEFVRGKGSGPEIVLFSGAEDGVVMTPEQIDGLVRFLRPDPARYTARKSGSSWCVHDEQITDGWIAAFDRYHPDPEGAARVEADRLNEQSTGTS